MNDFREFQKQYNDYLQHWLPYADYLQEKELKHSVEDVLEKFGII